MSYTFVVSLLLFYVADIATSYQNYEGLGPVLQMIRMLPMSVAGLVANISGM